MNPRTLFCFFRSKTTFILLISSFLYLGCGGSVTNTGSSAGAGAGSSPDTTPPSISSVTVTGQNYDTDANIDISVVFDENVTVTGEPTLALTIGADARTARYHSDGSGGATVVFRYTVVAGDSDTDGITISPTTISLPNSATIKDGANNDAALDLASHLPTSLGQVTVNVLRSTY